MATVLEQGIVITSPYSSDAQIDSSLEDGIVSEKYIKALTISALNFVPLTSTGSSTDIVGTLNASTEGIRIASSLISIDGSVSFSAGYDPTGKVAAVGGNYTSTSTAAAAKVKIFPDTSTGIIAYASNGTTEVFKVMVGGTIADPTATGDVAIGAYSAGAGVLWDQSAGKLYIKGDMTAGNITGVVIQGSKFSTGTTGNRVEMNTDGDDVNFYDSTNDLGLTVGLTSSTSADITASDSRQLILTPASGKGITLAGTTSVSAGLTVAGVLGMSDNIDMNSNSIQEVNNITAATINSTGNVRFPADVLLDSSGSTRKINSSGTNLRFYTGSSANHEFYQGTTIKAIIDENIWTNGDLQANGSKPFIIRHPDGSRRLLKYTAQESPDVSLRIRGKELLNDKGSFIILLPTHFQLITETTNINVNLTSTTSSQDLYVDDVVGNSYITIKGKPNTYFYYEVIGIRKGYMNSNIEIDESNANEQEIAMINNLFGEK